MKQAGIDGAILKKIQEARLHEEQRWKQESSNVYYVIPDMEHPGYIKRKDGDPWKIETPNERDMVIGIGMEDLNDPYYLTVTLLDHPNAEIGMRRWQSPHVNIR